MLNKIPEDLTEQQKEQYQEAWMSTLRTLVFAAKTMILVIALVLLYIPFGSYLENIFEQKSAVQNFENYISPGDQDPDKVENGIHLRTGLVYAAGFDQVRANCTVCHSAKLVTQNRATRAGWSQMIDWMQEKQGLWDLGDNRARILDYLEKHYAPEEKGRRENINIAEVEWYILNLEEE